jgi:hypothetical protein
VTDGTSAGTSELTVAGANSGGLFDLSFFPSGFSPGFTVPGTRALNGLFFDATEPPRIFEYAIASPAQCVMQSPSVPDAWRRFAAARPPRATFSKTNDQKINLVDPFR